MDHKKFVDEFILFAIKHLERTEQDVLELKILMEKLNAGLNEVAPIRQHTPD